MLFLTYISKGTKISQTGQEVICTVIFTLTKHWYCITNDYLMSA